MAPVLANGVVNLQQNPAHKGQSPQQTGACHRPRLRVQHRVEQQLRPGQRLSAAEKAQIQPVPRAAHFQIAGVAVIQSIQFPPVGDHLAHGAAVGKQLIQIGGDKSLNPLLVAAYIDPGQLSV